MLVLRALEATVPKDVPVTHLLGEELQDRDHFVLLFYLSLSYIYVNIIKCLIWGRGVFCLFIFILALCLMGSITQACIL